MSPWLIKSHLAEEQTLDAVLAIAVTLSTGKDPQRTPMTYWSEVLFIDFALAACREKNLMKWGAHHRNNFGNMRGNETQKAKMWNIAYTFKTYGGKDPQFCEAPCYNYFFKLRGNQTVNSVKPTPTITVNLWDKKTLHYVKPALTIALSHFEERRPSILWRPLL